MRIVGMGVGPGGNWMGCLGLTLTRWGNSLGRGKWPRISWPILARSTCSKILQTTEVLASMLAGLWRGWKANIPRWVSNIGIFEILSNFFCGKLVLIIVTEKPTLALHWTGLSLVSYVDKAGSSWFHTYIYWGPCQQHNSFGYCYSAYLYPPFSPGYYTGTTSYCITEVQSTAACCHTTWTSYWLYLGSRTWASQHHSGFFPSQAGTLTVHWSFLSLRCFWGSARPLTHLRPIALLS